MAWGDLNPRSLGYVRDAMPDFSTLHEQRPAVDWSHPYSTHRRFNPRLTVFSTTSTRRADQLAALITTSDRDRLFRNENSPLIRGQISGQ